MTRLRGRIAIVAIALFVTGCQVAAPPPAPPVLAPPPPPQASAGEVGLASWYKPDHGKIRTATGEAFDGNGLTAASRTLPLNSTARVTNLANGRSVVVRINDRGPYARKRIIDVSPRAARALGMTHHGLIHVRVEPIDVRTTMP